MEDKKFAENEEHQDNLEVTELDDAALEDASGGLAKENTVSSNENCGVC